MIHREKLHFIGIGGIGMSALARMYLSRGYAVQGTDLKPSRLLEDLEKCGAKVLIGHDAAHLTGATRVVYSSSIAQGHPERIEAARLGLRVMHRSEALAELCQGKFTIAVSGTHGKTTTTALIGTVLKEAGRDPSVVVGGLVRHFGGNACCGSGREIVIEADESDSSFLNFTPDIEVITNIEPEHLDHFRDIAHIEDTFRQFVDRLRKGGRLFGCAEDERVAKLMAEHPRESMGYGFASHHALRAENVVECPEGRRGVDFTVWKGAERLGDVRMNLLGRHNVLNALAAVSVGLELGIPFSTVALALGTYDGAARRFDVKLDGETLVVDDYAHHPTEIKKTLSAARGLRKKRIFAVFQPHRYTRTQALVDGFVSCFDDADTLIVTDVYSAGEAPIAGVSGENLADRMRLSGHTGTRYVKREDVFAAILSELRAGDLLITLGAGDICHVSDEVAAALRHRAERRNLFSEVRGRVFHDEPLARHTSLKVGGPADYWIEPEDLADLLTTLRICRERGLAVNVFGAGSNVLPPDNGFRGAVIHLNSEAFRSIRVAGDAVICGAGVPNTLFIRFLVDNGFSGCEFLSGIPGNIGGTIAMNAGSHDQSVDAYLQQVTVVGYDGTVRVLKKEEVPFSYRSSGLSDCVIAEAVFTPPLGNRERSLEKLEEYRSYRAGTQDLQHASAGCMFKNPLKPGCFAGKLIDEAGLKGKRIGNAQVSEKHANFIINCGGATSADVRALIDEVRNAVKENSGVMLDIEVKILGEPPSARRSEVFQKIAVLAGGPSCEREVSLVSGRAVTDALLSKGYDVFMVDPDKNLVEKLKAEKTTFVFIALHGTYGEDGTVQRILDQAGIPYTGCSADASELAFDKARAQNVLRRAGVRVPDFAVIGRASERKNLPAFPVVVKPSRAGSSVGVTLVREAAHLNAAVEEAFRWSDEVLVERYIEGRELTVGILGDEALPIVEIIAQRVFYDYEAKYGDQGTRYECPARLDEATAQRVTDAALSAYRALGASFLSRVDLILSADGRPYVLEANSIPGLTGKSLLPKAARAAGIDFPGLCVKIMEVSLVGKTRK